MIDAPFSHSFAVSLIACLYMNLNFTFLSNTIWQKFSLEFCQTAIEGVTGLFSERALLCVETCQRAGHMLIEIVSLSLSLCEGNRPETTKTYLQNDGISRIVYVHTLFNNVWSNRYEILFSLCVGCKQNNAAFVCIARINIACYQQRPRPELGCIKHKWLINTHFM